MVVMVVAEVVGATEIVVVSVSEATSMLGSILASSLPLAEGIKAGFGQTDGAFGAFFGGATVEVEVLSVGYSFFTRAGSV